MSSISSPTYDPVSTATALAQKYTSAAQQMIDNQTKYDAASENALDSLNTAMGAFRTALYGLTGFGLSMLKQSATLSDPSYGSATASLSAAPGTYSFYVDQVATAHQISYSNLTDAASTTGTLAIKLGGSSTAAFTVDLAAANADANGTLTVRELAAAINKATGNNAQVSAAVVTVGTTQQLVLTAGNTGVANSIMLDTSGMAAGSTWANNLNNAANYKEVTAAKDAKVWIGAQTTGTLITQASNTFSNVQGLKVTFTKAQTSGTPLTVTVATDSGGTATNAQAFIDAYNKLKTTLDKMVDPGDPSKKVAGGVFAHDSGIRELRNSLVNMLRPATGATLASYGIVANRDGILTLNSTQLNQKLAVDPTGLDAIMGSTSASAPAGLSHQLDAYIKKWDNDQDGKIKGRKDEIDSDQKKLKSRQDRLDNQYNSVYQQYLMQFTTLQNLQSQMSTNLSMFDALFGSNKSN